MSRPNDRDIDTLDQTIILWTSVMNGKAQLNDRITSCNLCPRLRSWCSEVATTKRKSYATDEYWAKPVPNFGDPTATHLIVGLAPAAHGANRTGRMFTGDRSGDWLFRALYKQGASTIATSLSVHDGLVLKSVLITAVCHCAPPDNKPTKDEMSNCSTFLAETLFSRDWRGILCLGQIAWEQTQRTLGLPVQKFGHGSQHGRLIASYHPSQQNTFTGRLTETMLDDVVKSWLEL